MMTDHDKKQLMTAGLVAAGILILVLLLRKPVAAGVDAASPAAGGVAGQTWNYAPGSFNLGGLPSDPFSVQILFPNSNASASCSCGGCDQSSALNQSFTSLADFVNQYTAGATAAQKDYAARAYSSVPDWLKQYVNTAAGAFAGG
jgi:hypothetical protein